MIERADSAPRRWVYPIVGGVALGVIVGVPYGTLAEHNDDEWPAIRTAAAEFAAQRNTCRITDAHIKPGEFGGPVLSITVALQSNVLPSTHDREFDRFGMNVDFVDAPPNESNLVSGMWVGRKQAVQGVPASQLTNRHGEGPDSAINTTEVQEPIWRTDSAEYEVDRINAVRALKRGFAATDTEPMGSGVVPCGRIRYDAQDDQLSILPPQ